MDLPPSQRFMKFDRIRWNQVFSKTYYEKRSFGHWLVNFNRIWIIHVGVYWFYTAYNSPHVYNGARSTPMKWSATALGGAVATVIMIVATVLEFSYIPTTWNNTFYLLHRLFFLLITLVLTAGPTIYIAITESRTPNQPVPLLLGILQFFISVIATIAFAVTPSGRMFGYRVASKSRKYLAGQTFTASYPSMTTNQRLSSVLLWLLVFGCKFTESYRFFTLSLRPLVDTMVGLKVITCNDKHFGDTLCTHQIAFTLAIMYIMDLVLFFMDTFLWWIIWNVALSIARSFWLGLSTWTPWRKIYTDLPTKIYSRLLPVSRLEIGHKPKVRASCAPPSSLHC